MKKIPQQNKKLHVLALIFEYYWVERFHATRKIVNDRFT